MPAKSPAQTVSKYSSVRRKYHTYSPFAASLAAYFVYQIATLMQMDVSSKTPSAAHLKKYKHQQIVDVTTMSQPIFSQI